MWEERMKMILNEYKLLPFQKEAQNLVATWKSFSSVKMPAAPGFVPEK